MGTCGGEYRACFFNREGVVIAEGVAKRARLRSRTSGMSFFCDPANVIVAATANSGGNVCAASSVGTIPHRTLGVEACHHTKHAQLSFALQSITDLASAVVVPARSIQSRCRRDSVSRSSSEAAALAFTVLRIRPGSRNLLIAWPGNALLEFGSTVARENHVRYARQQNPAYAAALRIDHHFVGRDLGLDFAIVPGCRDAVVLNQKRRISNYAQLVELRPTRGRAVPQALRAVRC